MKENIKKTEQEASQCETERKFNYDSPTYESQSVAITNRTSHHTYTGLPASVDSSCIISERIIDREVHTPKKIVHRDVVEKIIVIPETIQREEIIDEVRTVRERIIEVAKPVIQEKIVEIPEYIYVDKIVEVPQIICEEKIREVPKHEKVERVIEVPKIFVQEKTIEIPEIEYRESIQERVVEVPQIQDEVQIRQIPIPQFVTKEVPRYVNVEEQYEVQRNIPVPTEAVLYFDYHLPKLIPKVTKVQFPVYIPKFIETPIAEELVNPCMQSVYKHKTSQLEQLKTSVEAVSLCELENIAKEIRDNHIEQHVSLKYLDAAVQKAWSERSLNVTTPTNSNLNSNRRYSVH